MRFYNSRLIDQKCVSSLKQMTDTKRGLLGHAERRPQHGMDKENLDRSPIDKAIQ